MLGFVCALKKEAIGFLNTCENVKEFLIADKPAFIGKTNKKDFVMIISGIGKVSAALSTQLLIDKYNVEYIINFGTAGGTDDKVKCKNYYLIEKCCQFDFDVSQIDDVPLGYIQEYKRVYFDTFTENLDFLQKVNLASSDKFGDSKEENDVILSLNCSVRDMEGGAICQVCASNNVKMICIKGISDVYGSNTASKQFLENLDYVGKNFDKVINNLVKKL